MRIYAWAFSFLWNENIWNAVQMPLRINWEGVRIRWWKSQTTLCTSCPLVHAFKSRNCYMRWDETFYGTMNEAELNLLKWPFLCTIERLPLNCALFLSSVPNSLSFQYFQMTSTTWVIICVFFKVRKCSHIHLFAWEKPEKSGGLRITKLLWELSTSRRKINYELGFKGRKY